MDNYKDVIRILGSTFEQALEEMAAVRPVRSPETDDLTNCYICHRRRGQQALNLSNSEYAYLADVDLTDYEMDTPNGFKVRFTLCAECALLLMGFQKGRCFVEYSPRKMAPCEVAVLIA